jgi:hypothetical protein
MEDDGVREGRGSMVDFEKPLPIKHAETWRGTLEGWKD